MLYYEVAPTKVVRQNSHSFTYASEEHYSIGQIVAIEVGKQVHVGVVVAITIKPDYQTKQILHPIEPLPLPKPLVELGLWLSDYYATHLAIVWQAILPRGIEKTRRARTLNTPDKLRQRTNFVLNEDQLFALHAIQESRPETMVLYGVTGSGKTAVYIETVRQAIESGRSAIILVPEIALTSQVIDEFSSHFDNILVTHSHQTEAERHIIWREALTSTSPRVVIGPRSALFTPLKNIGVIIIDEAHEPSFKQEQSPRYSAIRAASVLGKHHEARVILGSATPSVSDFHIASLMHRPIIPMSKTARLSKPPILELVDMTKRENFSKHRFLSDTLIEKLDRTFKDGQQALIFHNRRGSASTTLCQQCGWQALCPRCFIPLTLHIDHHELRCHICDIHQKVPTACPVCASANILHKGIGTKLIESELRSLFPTIAIARFDGDNSDSDSLDKRYKELYDGTLQLIIGTQVVAKGLDLPHLRTVGIVQADAGLSLPDYSSSERTFQLLAQAVGRVGRSDHTTSVVAQTYQPHHPVITAGLAQNYIDFYNYTITERQRALFPPYTFLLKLTCIYKTEAAAVRQAQAFARILRRKFGESIEILGPVPGFYERIHSTYRWQLVIKSQQRSRLIQVVHLMPSSHWQFELDPTSLL